MSLLSTETPSGPRTKRLDRSERLDSHSGLCCRRGAAARKLTYLPQYLTSLLSYVTNDAVTLGLRYPFILIWSQISALMSATIPLYSDIVSYISSYISYDIRDVPDIVGGKNRAGFKIGPDIRVLTPISELKTRYSRWQEQGILYRVPDIGVFPTISDPTS